MNPVFIVIPLLAVLMFMLGTELKRSALADIVNKPRAVLVGLTGQILILPMVAFALAWAMELPPLYFMGVVLIACCPGGSSSNIFSLLVKGDVVLSITLTALSSVITLFTLPVIMDYTARFLSCNTGVAVELPVGKLLLQNLLLLFLPLIMGFVFRCFSPLKAAATSRVLGKVAFPALMLLAALFFLQYPREIFDNFTTLGVACSALIGVAMLCSSLLSRVSGVGSAARHTIVIEVGMQNAAQAIAVASSPFIFNSGEMALPAIIYALMMNVILLLYVYVLRHRMK